MTFKYFFLLLIFIIITLYVIKNKKSNDLIYEEDMDKEELDFIDENINKYLNLSDDDTVIGYLYIGTKKGKEKNIPNLDIKDFVSNI